MAWLKASRNWGLVVLGVWLIAYALLQLIPKLSIEGAGMVLAVVALVAGVLLILGK